MIARWNSVAQWESAEILVRCLCAAARESESLSEWFWPEASRATFRGREFNSRLCSFFFGSRPSCFKHSVWGPAECPSRRGGGQQFSARLIHESVSDSTFSANPGFTGKKQHLFFLELVVPSLHRGYANFLCFCPVFTNVRRHRWTEIMHTCL